MKPTQQSYEQLTLHGVKPSVQRLAVMEYLLTHRTHPTVDEIYRALVSKIPTLSKATVYNTLKLFVSHGLSRMLTIDEHNACFDADMSPHAHFFCTSCSHVLDLPMPVTDTNSLLGAAAGYRVDGVDLYYRGLCPSCVKRRAEESA